MSRARCWITDASRTSMGAFGGRHAAKSAIDLGVDAVTALNVQSPGALVLGNVVSAGLGQAPARQIVSGAELPLETPAWTVNRVCASGLMAAIDASLLLQTGRANSVIAVGAESMSRAPFYDDAARFGTKFGDQTLRDGLFWDGLRDFVDGSSMGAAADALAESEGYTRSEIDEWAAESAERARAVQATESIDGEPDEPLSRCRPEKLPALRPAFDPQGTTTAGNSSPLSDGACALLLSNASTAETDAEILDWHSASGPPAEFVSRPVDAIRALLSSNSLEASDIDLWEINEAFAVVSLHAQKALSLERSQVNARGGAVALGHPLGMTGARLLMTLRQQLIQRGGGTGVACACVGGGEAVAVLIRVG